MSNLKWIWWIVGLMVISITGIVWMQVNWIRDNIRVVEDQFDTEIFSFLNNVVHEIEQKQSAFTDPSDIQNIFGDEDSKDTTFSLWTDLFTEEEITQIQEGQIDFERLRDLIASAVLYKSKSGEWENKRITDLINLEDLDTSIRRNLRSRGIKTDYHYGILSNRDNNFVIMDGSYVVFPEEKVEATITEHNLKLLESPYATNIFQHEGGALGKLIIEFPTRNRFILSRIVVNLILSVIFIAITLFSFIYTIMTIFRQKQVSEIKTDFINNMTHEFKTPIATISLAVDSIRSPSINKDPEKVTKFAEIIRDENKRMLIQVEKVLQTAQLNNRRIKMSIKNVDVHFLLNQAKNHIALQIDRRNGKISLALEAPIHIIEGDENHLSNIFHNLLDNANKYSPDTPKIEIHTWNGEGGLFIEIKDHGQGMNADQIKNIFEKFYRIPTGNVHNVKGFGLGLSYVKAIVDAHHGTIEVKSTPGKGSQFILFFPFKMKEEKK